MKLANFHLPDFSICPNHAGLVAFQPAGGVVLSFGNKIDFKSPVIGYRDSYNRVLHPVSKQTPPQTRALIVDDEVDICYLLKGILRHANVDADYVTSLTEAREMLKKSTPPVIFLDNHLSDGLGIEHISKFKQEYPDSTIVMITAHDTAADRQKAYNEGVDFFIGKPFTRDTIIKTIEKIHSTNVE